MQGGHDREGSSPAWAPFDHDRPGFGPVPVEGVVGHDHGIDILFGVAAVPQGKNVAAGIVFGRMMDGVLFRVPRRSSGRA